mmetsp:Transcript_11245/g.47989  ORF Transcript_11245/g.47989 Transcript_11245/m.47989 type:complete len:209 (+) Transcript_11245:1903-2529(+)
MDSNAKLEGGCSAPGPIFEQGTFAGKSTVAIATGIKDSGIEKTFIANDIFPAAARAVDSNTSTNVPYYWKTNLQNSSKVDFWIKNRRLAGKDKAQYEKVYAKFYDAPGGLLHVLYASLEMHGVTKYVSIVAGETLPPLLYQLFWTDSSHTISEIRANMDVWKHHTRSGQNTWYAFHDSSPANRDELTKNFKVVHSIIVDSIFVIEVSA